MAKFLQLAPLLLAALALGGCGGSEQSSQQPPPPAVEVAEVTTGPATLWGDFTGRVAAPESVELRPRVSGYIDKVAFKEGELVLRGDLLFEIDPRPYRARERAAAAQLTQAQSELTLAESQATRAEQLLASRAISREEFDRRKSEQASARAAVSAAAAELESARLDLEYTKVIAPISGRVGRAQVTRGNLASANQTLLTTLVSVDPMYVYFESDQQTYTGNRDFFSPQRQPLVRIGLAGEQGFPHLGNLDFIDNRLNSSTGTIQFRAQVPNPGGVLKPGQFARVQMPTEQLGEAVLINRKAVLTDQDRRFVYVLSEKNTVERRPVEIGPTQEELVLIRSGLDAGEMVVVNGLQKIFFAGMTVTPKRVAMGNDTNSRDVARR